MQKRKKRLSKKSDWAGKGEKDMSYDYREAIKDDIRDYLVENETIDENTDFRELEDRLNEDLLACDSVTGDCAGYVSNATSKEYVMDNIDLLNDLCEEGLAEKDVIGDWFLNEDWKKMDVSIRRSLLSECIHDVLEEKEDELEEMEDESEDEDEDLGSG